jgi:hypothetical protein
MIVIQGKFALTVRELTGLIAQLPDPNAPDCKNTFRHPVQMDDGGIAKIKFERIEVMENGKLENTNVWIYRGLIAVTDKVL